MNAPIEVRRCYDCPFAVKERWTNDDGDSGTEMIECRLAWPIAYEQAHLSARQSTLWSVLDSMRAEMCHWSEPPKWCPLRNGPQVVELKKTP